MIAKTQVSVSGYSINICEGLQLDTSTKRPWNKSLNFIFPTKYVIPKSLKVGHWLSQDRVCKEAFPNASNLWRTWWIRMTKLCPLPFENLPHRHPKLCRSPDPVATAHGNVWTFYDHWPHLCTIFLPNACLPLSLSKGCWFIINVLTFDHGKAMQSIRKSRFNL